MPTEDRRRVRVLVAIVVALAVFFAGRMMLTGGESDAPIAEAAPASVLAGKTQVTATTYDVGFGPVDTFDVYATRNPFEPVVQVTPTTSPFTPTTSPFGGTTPPTTSFGTTPTTDGFGTTTTTRAPSFEPPAGTPVALLDVFDENGVTRARVQVGSTVYTVGIGDVFATSYRVVDLAGQCGEFLFGDSPFSLCEGQQVVK